MHSDGHLDYLYTMRFQSEKTGGHRAALAVSGGPAPIPSVVGAYHPAPGAVSRLWGPAAKALVIFATLAVTIWYGWDRILEGSAVLKSLSYSVGRAFAPDPLSVGDVKARVVVADDKSTLLVQGFLTNTGSDAVSSRDLRIALVGSDRVERYSWKVRPSQSRIAAGAHVRFDARLESPPPGVVDAVVSLVISGR